MHGHCSTLHKAASRKDLNVYKPSKKQTPLYWFLDSYFGFPIVKKLWVAVFSITWCCSCSCFSLIFHSHTKKSFLGALSVSASLFHSLFNTGHVFIPKFSIPLHSLLCNLHTSTPAADSFSPKTCNLTHTLSCLRLKLINSSFTWGKVSHLKCFSRKRQILQTEPEKGLLASLSHFQIWYYAQLLRKSLT